MKHYLPPILTLLIVIGVIYYGRQPVPNPDPNHTHADFAVWVDGKQLDFSNPAFMSGLSTDDSTHDEEDEVHDKYLHLHDGNGHVMHSHQSGETIGDFFRSLGVIESSNGVDLCLTFPQLPQKLCADTESHTIWVMELDNDHTSITPVDFNYVFKDEDKILIAFTVALPESAFQNTIDDYWKKMTDDACLYSKTCPWRGTPPTENCIADPLIPCLAP